MKTAMILAAGRGERLKPLTDEVAKALCPVHEKPLIEYHLIKLANAGFERVVINHAYLGGQIRRHLGDGTQWNIEICYTPEPPGGLETGGGIYNALPLLGDKPFLTINADIFTDYDFKTLAFTREAMAKLVLTPDPKHNPIGDFGLDNDGYLNHEKLYTFTGIAYYHPQLFQRYQAGRYSIRPIIHALVDEHLAQGELFKGWWIDCGSLKRLKLANNKNYRPERVLEPSSCLSPSAPSSTSMPSTPSADA